MSYTTARVEARPAYKLVSSKDTLLGTITFPADWDDMLNGPYGGIGMAYYPDLPKFFDAISEPTLPSPRKLFSLRYVRGSQYRDALRLDGISLEEFETLPGCTFSPGAGYLRSLIEG